VNKKRNDELIFSNILLTDDDFPVLAIVRLLCGLHM